MRSTFNFKKHFPARSLIGAILVAITFFLPVLAFQPAVSAAACTTISSLPFTINASGKYCLSGDLSYSANAGSAIVISAGNVLLDLQGYTISGGGTVASAIGTSGNHRSITVRNGTVKGFRDAIRLGSISDTTSDSVVENLRLQDCQSVAIDVSGNGNIIRNNQVVNTREQSFTDSGTSGIAVAGSSNAILNNDIVDTIAAANLCTAIVLNPSDRSIIENNRIERTAGEPGGTYAIYIGSSTNVLVVNNRIIRSDFGINFTNSTGIFRDNIAIGCTNPYSGGTNGGNNQ